MSQHRRAVLMGDPTHFSIKGGGNPHTRNIWGQRKSVNRELAIKQWHQMAKTLDKFGVDVFVVPPDQQWPGMVYPANAGFLTKLDEKIPIQNKDFILSNLLPTREGEKKHYNDFLTNLGFNTKEITRRFEGEADFFPVGDKYIFTYGNIEKQRFKFRLGFPPWKRIYGFRSDQEVVNELRKFVPQNEILQQTLVDEAHYHGDTVFCAIGQNKEYLIVFLEGLTAASQELLKRTFKDNLIPIQESDARRYASNSFQTIYNNTTYLFMPSGLSSGLLDKIKERNVTPVEVDVTEFMKKGGGSVKCMIGDLGWLIDDTNRLSNQQKNFREEHKYTTIFR